MLETSDMPIYHVCRAIFIPRGEKRWGGGFRDHRSINLKPEKQLIINLVDNIYWKPG